MAQFRTSKGFDAVFVVALLGIVGLAYLNRQAVNDWYFTVTHSPSAKTIAVADAAGLSAEGRRMLYLGDPVFGSAATVTAVCDQERLGCLTEHGQIYVVDDPAKPNQTVVTAAHEMLHLAYRRLSADRKTTLDPLISADLNRHAETGLNEELSDLTATADRLDEAHSLLGTEYQDLSAELSAYYATYFTDRTKVLNAETASQAE